MKIAAILSISALMIAGSANAARTNIRCDLQFKSWAAYDNKVMLGNKKVWYMTFDDQTRQVFSTIDGQTRNVCSIGRCVVDINKFAVRVRDESDSSVNEMVIDRISGKMATKMEMLDKGVALFRFFSEGQCSAQDMQNRKF